MIQANCRARFTASDFEFIVRTLCRRSNEAVSLSELLSDLEARDTILDNEQLVRAMLEQPGALTISSHLYFYVLTRHVLKKAGFTDRKLCDYIAAVLEAFSASGQMHVNPQEEGSGQIYVSDLLLALQKADRHQTFLIRSHVGNYTLFVSGIFHENLSHRSRNGAPDFSFYEEMGRSSFKMAASHEAAKRADLVQIYGQLAEAFHEVRIALNRLSDELLNLDEEIPLVS